MCHMSLKIIYYISIYFHLTFSDKMVELVDGGSVINGAYPVYFFLELMTFLLDNLTILKSPDWFIRYGNLKKLI